MAKRSVGEPASTSSEAAPPAVEPEQARSQIAEARRLYDVAVAVHEQRVPGAADAAPLAHRSLTVALRLLVQLRGQTPPTDFATLVDRAGSILTAESLTGSDLRPDLGIVAEMQERFGDPTARLTSAEDRRFGRALDRCEEIIEAVESYATERIGHSGSVKGGRWKTWLGVTAALVAGVLIGMRIRPHHAAPAVVQGPGPAQSTPAAQKSAEPPPVGFRATFFRDTSLTSPVVQRVDRSVDFDWGPAAPEGLDQSDHFGARWEGNLFIARDDKYRFLLTSDDGSRLFIDDQVVVDNWGAHAEVTVGNTVELKAGVHPIRVEFFDEIGNALVKLTWASEQMPERPITSEDLR